MFNLQEDDSSLEYDGDTTLKNINYVCFFALVQNINFIMLLVDTKKVILNKNFLNFCLAAESWSWSCGG